MTERKATEHIGPGQPVTDENSREAVVRKTVTLPIYGEDGTVRHFTFEVPIDTEIPPGAFIHTRGPATEASPVKYPIDPERELALERALVADMQERLNREVRTTEGLLRDRNKIALEAEGLRGRVNRLETDVNMIELERDALKTELAELRVEFAAEVQANIRLQNSRAKNLEEAIDTINALVKHLP